jgi:hypothetical protein
VEASGPDGPASQAPILTQVGRRGRFSAQVRIVALVLVLGLVSGRFPWWRWGLAQTILWQLAMGRQLAAAAVAVAVTMTLGDDGGSSSDYDDSGAAADAIGSLNPLGMSWFLVIAQFLISVSATVQSCRAPRRRSVNLVLLLAITDACSSLQS